MVKEEKLRMQNRKLLKNTVIVAIGQICTKFISFFLLPFYTEYLNSSEFGVVDLLNTFVSLIIPIISFQLDQAVFRFLIDSRSDENKKNTIITTSMFSVIIQALIFSFFYLSASIFWKNEYQFFFLINVLATLIASVLLQISRGIGNNVLYSTGSLISGVITIVCNVIFIAFFKLGAYGMLLGTFLGNFISTVFLVWKLHIFSILKFKNINKNVLKKLLKYSIPLIPNAISWWIVNASDRVIISKFLGLGENGVYSAANKFSNICITFFYVFSLTWTESAAVHYQDTDKEEYFSDIYNKTIKLFTSFCFMIIAILPFTFNFFIRGESYSSAYYQIPILLVSTIFNIVVSMYGSIYVAAKNSKEIARTSIYSALINIIVNLLLIKFLGLYAASLSTLIAYFAMSLYRGIDSKKYVRIDIDKKFIAISAFVCMLLITIYYQKNMALCIIGLMLIIIESFIYNYPVIVEFYKFIISKIRKIKNVEI